MIRSTTDGGEEAILFGQSGRAHVLAPGSIGSGDPPTNLAYGSEVAVVVDEGALRDLAGHETDFEIQTLPPKMYGLG